MVIQNPAEACGGSLYHWETVLYEISSVPETLHTELDTIVNLLEVICWTRIHPKQELPLNIGIKSAYNSHVTPCLQGWLEKNWSAVSEGTGFHKCLLGVGMNPVSPILLNLKCVVINHNYTYIFHVNEFCWVTSHNS